MKKTWKTWKTTQNLNAVGPGKQVKVGSITALVTAHTIRQDINGELYLAAIEVTWWEGSERCCYDVQPWEVTPAETDTARIGF